MFILFEPKIKSIVQKYLGYSEMLIMEMNDDYLLFLEKLYISKGTEFVENSTRQDLKNKLDQYANISQIKQMDEQDQIVAVQKLYVFFLKLINEEPELRDEIKKEIKNLDYKINKSLLKSLPPQALTEISEVLLDYYNTLSIIKKSYPDIKVPEFVK